MMNEERRRLDEARTGTCAWRQWGPYLSDRQWGTVREDYSPSGTAWEFFPHDHARSRAYRWGEDGLLGISDDQGLLCFALSMWNGRDPILKERLFGLTGNEGNHGEDLKEYVFFHDATPTNSYLRGLYKYPTAAFPYAQLVDENKRRTRLDPEYELIDTGVFEASAYLDIEIEYAKATPGDLVIRIGVTNRGPEPAELVLLPTLWFRNTWTWAPGERKPSIERQSNAGGVAVARASHHHLGDYWLACDRPAELLFTENETNVARLWGGENASPFMKDAFDRYVIHGERDAVNPDGTGTKMAARWDLGIAPGATAVVRLRLSDVLHHDPFADVDEIVARRRGEADRFYDDIGGASLSADERLIQRQALAGMLWSKQYYAFDVTRWLEGDPGEPPPPPERLHGRNAQWRHLANADVISMPDKWEYPWYAAWDLAFHCLPLALVDPDFAKQQLLLFLNDSYMHPNGQIPAYEWAFSDVNPPVHGWAAWRVYELDRRRNGTGDREFLERVFQRLLLNFGWWVNRKDQEGNNIFSGGFLGLDNIGVFDRSMTLPEGMALEQSDATAWMGMYASVMAAMAIELARDNPVYEDLASKFFQHYMFIAGALNNVGDAGVSLWDQEDEFFYDVLRFEDGRLFPLKVRSLVGLMPMMAVRSFAMLHLLPFERFLERSRRFLLSRPDLAALLSPASESHTGNHTMVSFVRGDRLRAVLKRMLDPDEFLSEYGIRSISRHHLEHPYAVDYRGNTLLVRYEPAESTTGMFGGNSNWRGPVWFPINYLLIEALREYHRHYGAEFTVEFPTGSGVQMNLEEVANELSARLIRLFSRTEDGRRPVFGGTEMFQTDPHWRDHILFYEYFHGDNGAGIGASHQTGWTGLVATLLEEQAERASRT